eukprot:30602_1
MILIAIACIICNAFALWQKQSDGGTYVAVHFSDVTEQLSWWDANDYCKREFGTELAIVQDKDDENEIENIIDILIQEYPPGSTGLKDATIFIGHRDQQKIDIWSTCDSASCYRNTHECSSWNAMSGSWHTTYPNYNTKERCGSLYISNTVHKFKWWGDACTTKRDFICNTNTGKYGIGKAKPKCENTKSTATVSKNGNYIAIDVDKTEGLRWSEAQLYCKRVYGTSLATITTTEESTELQNVVRGMSDLYQWIGWRDWKGFDFWAPCDRTRCVNNDKQYSCSAHDDQDNYSGHKVFANGPYKCGTIQRNNGKWYGQTCTLKNNFVCNAPNGKYGRNQAEITCGLPDFSAWSKPDPNCETGIKSTTGVCCPSTCTECGGSGKWDCSGIGVTNSCDTHPPPCIVTEIISEFEPDPFCDNGVKSIDNTICCPSTCDECSALGIGDCSTNNVINSCATSAAPCVIATYDKPKQINNECDMDINNMVELPFPPVVTNGIYTKNIDNEMKQLLD